MIDKTRKQLHNMIITVNIPYLHKGTFYLTSIIQHLLINVLQKIHTYTLKKSESKQSAIGFKHITSETRPVHFKFRLTIIHKQRSLNNMLI